MKLLNLGIAVFTAVFASALVAQNNDTINSAPETTLKVNSRAVLVDVIVTDRIGNPVKTMPKPGTECAVIDCATDLEQ